MSHDAYIRRETMIAIVINSLLSLVFFLIVFGRPDSVVMWGMGQWVFDFLPQSFMVALMSTLVPGALTAKKLRDGVLTPLDTPSRLPRSLPVRALMLAIIAALGGAAIVAAAMWASGLTSLGWTTALVLKVAYGATLGAIIAPIGLRSALAG